MSIANFYLIDIYGKNCSLVESNNKFGTSSSPFGLANLPMGGPGTFTKYTQYDGRLMLKSLFINNQEVSSKTRGDINRTITTKGC